MQGNVDIRHLIVTQNSLRDYTQVAKMIDFVKAGGRFTRDARLAQSLLASAKRGLPPPIHIAAMEDGQMMLHDGHHRAVALFLGGRYELEESEYEVGHYTYPDYFLPNPTKGWFTPFDLATECRLPDFWYFKARIKKLYDLGLDWKLAIHEGRHHYAVPRIITTVQELSERYTNGHDYHYD